MLGCHGEGAGRWTCFVQKMASSKCSFRGEDMFGRGIWRTGQKIDWGGSFCHAKEFGAYSIGQPPGFNRGRHDGSVFGRPSLSAVWKLPRQRDACGHLYYGHWGHLLHQVTTCAWAVTKRSRQEHGRSKIGRG